MINHYQVSADGKTTLLYETKSDAVTDMPGKVTVEPLTIANYLYDESRTKLIQNGTTSIPTDSPIAVVVETYKDGFTLNLYYVEDEATIDYRIVYPDGTVNEAEAVCGALSSYTETLGVANGIVTGSVAAVSNTDYYDFEGWYTDESCTIALAKNWVTETENGTKLTPQKNGEIWTDTIYYAKFKEKQATIHYVAVGPDLKPLTDENIGKVEPISETVNILTGTANGSTATLTGMDAYKFVGWYTDAECTIPVNRQSIPDGTLSGENNESFVPAKEPEDTSVQPPKPAAYETATFYAKFKYNITTLTITKKGVEAADPNASFVFHVEGKDVDLDVVIKGNGSVTINGLTVGKTYTVTETAGNWRYTPDVKSKKITLEVSGNEVTFTNKRDHDNWLDGDCYIENVFKGVSNQ